MHRRPQFIGLGLLLGLAGSAWGEFTETFDEWAPADLSYGAAATYHHAGVGTWVSYNALARTDRSRSGNAVRFNDETPAPWLEFRGLDGNGVDGGIDTVSFYYRHWDGGSGDVAFQLQYRIGTGAWINAGSETLVPNDTFYRLFSYTLGLTGDDIGLRILGTRFGERLLIDDLTIGVGVSTEEPVVSFVDATMTVDESAGTLLAAIQIMPPAAATVEVAVVQGDATPGSDFSWAPTSLVFRADAPVQNLSIAVVDDDVEEGTERVQWEISGAIGATIDPSADRYQLTILDNDALNTNGAVFTVMAANTTSGNNQSYQDPGIRIFEALDPDIVAVQEFTVSHAGGVRGFVDDTFGTNFHFMIEGGSEQIPNGVISRWPITASGEWDDPQVDNRDFAWATIDIPGPIDLHVVSVHLHNSGGVASRSVEAETLVTQIQRSFPADDFIVLAGDFNTGSRTEDCVQTLKTILVDTHVPKDQFGDDDTNAGRNKPYDWVMVNPALDARHESLVVGGTVFAEGMVFDTRLWNPPPSPAWMGDSGVDGMQHMAVIKAFSIPDEPPGPVTLVVQSPHGSPDPAVGTSSHAFGSTLSPSVPEPLITEGSTQAVLKGWVGTGSVPTAGTGNTVPPTNLTLPSTLSWQWGTNFWLVTTNAATSSGWREAGTTISLTPVVSNYFTFAGWEGDVPPSQVNDNPLVLVMDRPRSVSAGLSADRTALGTPHYWLAGFGYSNNFEVADQDDVDADGMPAWAEYVAGTIPTNATSRMEVNRISHAGAVTIFVDTQPGRTYGVEYRDELIADTGTTPWQPFAAPAHGEFYESGPVPGTHRFTDDYGPSTTGAPPASGHRVYRVRVRMP